jgi:hypothetical protein
MKRAWLFLAVAWVLSGRLLLGGPSDHASVDGTDATKGDAWDLSISAAGYFVRNGRDYVNPTVMADHDWLHVEARYNYEAYRTGSLWMGYNFSAGDKLALEVTPMIGGVFGDIAGVAPGYTITLSYELFALYTQGEYFIDAETRDGNFFYNWSEFTCSPTDWFKFGLVLDRTKAFGSNFDIRRGPLLGFKYKTVDLTAYWLSPGATDSTIVLSVALNF